MNKAQLINQTSGCVEWYTPPYIIEAVRKTLGLIELDPASSPKANEIVQADKYYTIQDDGLCLPWMGQIFLNHPFGKTDNAIWIKKLVGEYNLGHISEACCITYACTSEKWFQPLFNYPMCFISPRVNYIGVDGKTVKGVTKGSVVTYMGNFEYDFIKGFDGLGRFMIPW